MMRGAQVMNEAQVRQHNGGYLHGEAFMLMEYASADGCEVEYIYNSRDGVTPFIVTSRRGTELQHANWQRDRRIPNFVPQPGSRIFVDLTEDAAREYTRREVERFWDDAHYPMREMFDSKDEALDRLAASKMEQPGQPDVKVVE